MRTLYCTGMIHLIIGVALMVLAASPGVPGLVVASTVVLGGANVYYGIRDLVEDSEDG